MKFKKILILIFMLVTSLTLHGCNLNIIVVYTEVGFTPFEYIKHGEIVGVMDYSHSGPSVPGILQARILEWVAMPSSRGSSQPKDRTRVSYVSCIGRQVLYH